MRSRDMNKDMNRVRISDMTDREYELYKRRRSARREASRRAKMNLFRLVGAFVLVVVIVIGFRCAATKSSATNRIESCKFYKTITMEYNQSLRDVAEYYFDEHYDSVEEYLNEIESINHVYEGSAIPGGKTLYIPYYDIPVTK